MARTILDITAMSAACGLSEGEILDGLCMHDPDGTPQEWYDLVQAGKSKPNLTHMDNLCNLAANFVKREP